MGYGKVRPTVDVNSILGLNPSQEKEERDGGPLTPSGVQEDGSVDEGVKEAGATAAASGSVGAAPKKRGRPLGSKNRVVGNRDHRYEFKLSSNSLMKLKMVASRERLTVPALLAEVIEEFLEKSPKARFLKDIDF